MSVKLQNGKVITAGGKVSCDCCAPPAELFLDFKGTGAYCENTCGAVPDPILLPDGQTFEESATIGEDGPCPYDILDRIENANEDLLVGDSCAYYARFRRQDDYTVVRGDLGSGCEFIFPGKIEDYATNYTATATGVDSNTGIVSFDCTTDVDDISGDGGYPGNSRSGFYRYENKITSCPILFPAYPATWTTAPYGVTVSAQRSKSGNLRIIDKAIYKIPASSIPTGSTAQVKKTIQKFGLSEGTCSDWVATTTSEITENYTGGEIEFNPDTLLQQIQDDEIPAIETYAVEVTLTAQLV